jgi:hypothetical protein
MYESAPDQLLHVCPAAQAGLFCAPSDALHMTAAPCPLHSPAAAQNETERM